MRESLPAEAAEYTARTRDPRPLFIVAPLACSLDPVKFPWHKDASTTPEPDEPQPASPVSGATNKDSSAQSEGASQTGPKTAPTPPKGRPTPKRRDQEIARGVIRGTSMAPSTPGQQRERRKELKNSMSKDEWKQYKREERDQRRAAQRDAQARMDAGEEQYLLARDKGPERRYVRDWVDARRFANNYVMPAAIVVLIVMFVSNLNPQLAQWTSLLALAFILIFFIEAIIIGRRANAAVRKHFPGTSATGFGLGMYAYSRASQPRRWRTPRPQVDLGADV